MLLLCVCAFSCRVLADVRCCLWPVLLGARHGHVRQGGTGFSRMPSMLSTIMMLCAASEEGQCLIQTCVVLRLEVIAIDL